MAQSAARMDSREPRAGADRAAVPATLPPVTATTMPPVPDNTMPRRHRSSRSFHRHPGTTALASLPVEPPVRGVDGPAAPPAEPPETTEPPDPGRPVGGGGRLLPSVQAAALGPEAVHAEAINARNGADKNEARKSGKVFFMGCGLVCVLRLVLARRPGSGPGGMLGIAERRVGEPHGVAQRD